MNSLQVWFLIYIFYYFYFNFIVVWKQSLPDSYSLKFGEVCFIAWNVANFCNCSMCVFEKNIYTVIANSVMYLLTAAFNTFISLLIFLSTWPVIIDRDNLRPLSMITDLSVSPWVLSFLEICYLLANFWWYKLRMIISSRWVKCYQYVMILYILKNGFY